MVNCLWSPSVDSRYSFPPPVDPMTLKDKRNKYLSVKSLKINRFDSKNDCIRFGYSTSALKFDILLYLQYKRVTCLTRVIRLPYLRLFNQRLRSL